MELSKIECMTHVEVNQWVRKYSRQHVGNHRDCEHGHAGCSTEDGGPCFDEAMAWARGKVRQHGYVRPGCLRDLYVVGDDMLVVAGRVETIIDVRPTRDGDIRVITADKPRNLKRFALIPSEREKECHHEHAPYSGAIPCTGPRICTMCGARIPEEGER